LDSVHDGQVALHFFLTFFWEHLPFACFFLHFLSRHLPRLSLPQKYASVAGTELVGSGGGGGAALGAP